MRQIQLAEDHSKDQESFNPMRLVNREDLNEFKDFTTISLMAEKHKTSRARIISALIAAQAKQEEIVGWQY